MTKIFLQLISYSSLLFNYIIKFFIKNYKYSNSSMKKFRLKIEIFEKVLAQLVPGIVIKNTVIF